MKYINHLLIIGIIVSVILNSCSVEKRVYRSGYHMEWSKRSIDRIPQNSESDNDSKQTRQRQNISEVKPESKIGNRNESDISNEIATEKMNPKRAEIPASESITTTSRQNVSSDKIAPDPELNSQLKNKETKTKVENGLKSSGGGGKSGWFFLICGLLLLLLAWVFYTYLGIFGLILGLIVAIGGAIYVIVGIVVLLVNI